MKLTPEELDFISASQTFWMPFSFKGPEKFIYIGYFYDYHRFINDERALKVNYKSFNNNNELRINGLYSTYEECCEKMRELCLDTISHFNSHQLKNNPIIVQ